MKDIITMTSKGTFTLPVKIRKSMDLRGKGDQLIISFDPTTKIAEISRPQSFLELQKRTAKYITKQNKPLLDVSGFYQRNR